MICIFLIIDVIEYFHVLIDPLSLSLPFLSPLFLVLESGLLYSLAAWILCSFWFSYRSLLSGSFVGMGPDDRHELSWLLVF